MIPFIKNFKNSLLSALFSIILLYGISLTFANFQVQAVSVPENQSSNSIVEEISPWTSNGATLDTPAMAEYHFKVVQAVRGTDNGVYTRFQQVRAGMWSPWVRDGETLSAPILSNSGNQFILTIRGTDNMVYQKVSFGGETWQEWTQLGIKTLNAPAQYECISHSTIRIVQAVVSEDRSLYVRGLTSAYGSEPTFSSWVRLPGSGLFPPSVYCNKDEEDRLSIAYGLIGTDNNIYFGQGNNETYQLLDSWKPNGSSNFQLTTFGQGFIAYGVDNKSYYAQLDLGQLENINWKPLINHHDLSSNLDYRFSNTIGRFVDFKPFTIVSYRDTSNSIITKGLLTDFMLGGNNPENRLTYTCGNDFVSGKGLSNVVSVLVQDPHNPTLQYEVVRGTDNGVYTRVLRPVADWNTRCFG